MADMGFMNAKVAKRFRFFRQAEDTLKFLSEIQKDLDWNNKEIIDKTCNIISDLIDKEMNSAPPQNVENQK